MDNFVVDDTLLEEFISGFYGYGSFDSPVWFIGMEEGLSGKNLADKRNCISTRLQAWEQRGKRTLDDLYEYHQAIQITKFFKEQPPTQPTWRGLIKFYLSYKHHFVGDPKGHLKSVREYQRDKLGRTNFLETTLMELMPLPCKNLKKTEWTLYSGESKIPFLGNRKKYWSEISPRRGEMIANMIKDYSPEIVIFYSLSKKYQDTWQIIAEDVNFQDARFPGERYGYKWGKNTNTFFAITPHPAAVGISKDFFIKLGEKVREKVC